MNSLGIFSMVESNILLTLSMLFPIHRHYPLYQPTHLSPVYTPTHPHDSSVQDIRMTRNAFL